MNIATDQLANPRAVNDTATTSVGSGPDPLYVTRPYLPPLEEFIPYLQKIWGSHTLTNGGPMHQQFELALGDYLGVEHISLFSNGTQALVTALQALRISGQVITTPYSFVATAHSLVWNGITPIFVDVASDSYNLDPACIEAAITPQTTAIMPVHCYGHPCDVDGIQRIADKYNLRVIYDAAHAFGVKDVGGSILRHGDLSVLSFHATKVFNTFEGGAIVCPSAKVKAHIDHLKNFGFVDEETVVAPGVNGKMNEFSAALGLLQLRHIDRILHSREKIHKCYIEKLSEVPNISWITPSIEFNSNYSYFPILVGECYPLSRDALYQAMRAQGVFARRYFYPLISDFSVYCGLPSSEQKKLPNAHYFASRVLCLPIFPAMSDEDVSRVVGIIRRYGSTQA